MAYKQRSYPCCHQVCRREGQPARQPSYMEGLGAGCRAEMRIGMLNHILYKLQLILIFFYDTDQNNYCQGNTYYRMALDCWGPLIMSQRRGAVFAIVTRQRLSILTIGVCRSMRVVLAPIACSCCISYLLCAYLFASYIHIYTKA
jgi:hypothetical protein